MVRGFLGTVIVYLIFIILPFVYLLTSIYTLMTNETRLAVNTDAVKEQQTRQIYQA